MNNGLQEFLNGGGNLPKLIIVYGPTASGKTSLSIDIASELGTDIISADSRQIYRYMDIGTAKVTPEEMSGITHHMIDIIDPDQVYSTGKYVEDAQFHIDQLISQNKIPVMCGGTGLYIDAVRYQFDMPGVVADQNMREELEKIRIEKGNQGLWNELEKLDPLYASQLHPNNYQYVMRAIEVFRTTGKSKLELGIKKEPRYDVYMIAPDIENREVLYSRINKRVDIMIDQGLVEEVSSILSRYKIESFDSIAEVTSLLPGMNTIGYKEVLSYMLGEIDIQKMRDLIAQNSRKYAKRQLTWWRGNI